MLTKSFNISLRNKINPFKKTIKVDSDKSISIRSFLIGSICQGISKTRNVLESEDVFSSIKCLKKLNVKIKKIQKRQYLIYGKGLGSLYAKKNTKLDFGNSGTLARLLIGIISSTPNLELKLVGDKSLNKRNMENIVNLMTKFGAFFLPKNKFNFPLKVLSTTMPVGINYKSGVSAQLKSAVILAGLNSYGLTEIIEKEKSRDHTENMLLHNTHAFKIKKNKTNVIRILGRKFLKPLDINVPGDPSSAAFYTALTVLNKNSYLKIKNVGLNPTRTGFFKLLKKSGAKITFTNLKTKYGESIGDIHVRSSNLKPIVASKKYYTNSTDEYPILFVIAALTKGTSIFKGIEDLANKESNRIKEMQNILKQLGIKSRFKKNELKIFGSEKIVQNNKCIIVKDLGDHRICMSTFILANLTGSKTIINNFETVNTSSPSFLKIMKVLGAKFEKN